MKKSDAIYLEDIVEAIDKMSSFLEGFTFNQFEMDDKTQFAVFHALEVVGEAANKLSVEFSQANPSLPIREAVELRNFLIHGYDQIDLKIVWKTVKEYIPQFKLQIEQITKPAL